MTAFQSFAETVNAKPKIPHPNDCNKYKREPQ